MTCPEAIDVMGEAVEGRLDPAVRPGFEDHLAECRSCRTYFEHLAVTRAALRLLPPAGRSSPHRGDLITAFLREFGRD